MGLLSRKRWIAALVCCLSVIASPASASAVDVTLQTPDRYFSPDGDGREDTASVSYVVSELSRVSIAILDATGAETVRHIQTDVATLGNGAFSWDGRADGTTTVSPDGAYRYRVTAVNAAGDSKSVEGRIGIDTQAVARLVAPAPDEIVTATTQIRVTPEPGRSLTGGTIYRCSSASTCGGAIGSLGAAGADGVRTFNWNTAAYPSGEQYLWAYADYNDAFGRSHSYVLPPRRVVVSRPVTISNVSPDRYFSPDGDGQEDTVAVGYTVNAAGTATARIRDAGGTLVRRTMTDLAVAEGSHSLTWDGRDEAGATVPDGVYTFTLDVVGTVGEPASATGRIGVDTQSVAQMVAPGADEVVSGVVQVRVAPAPGRTLTGATIYRCSSASTCGGALGSLGPRTRWAPERWRGTPRRMPIGNQYLWGYAEYNDAFGRNHSLPIAAAPRRRSRGRSQITNSRADRYFSPDGDGHEDTIGVGYTPDRAGDRHGPDPRRRRRTRPSPARPTWRRRRGQQLQLGRPRRRRRRPRPTASTTTRSMPPATSATRPARPAASASTRSRSRRSRAPAADEIVSGPCRSRVAPRPGRALTRRHDLPAAHR